MPHAVVTVTRSDLVTASFHGPQLLSSMHLSNHFSSFFQVLWRSGLKPKPTMPFLALRLGLAIVQDATFLSILPFTEDSNLPNYS